MTPSELRARIDAAIPVVKSRGWEIEPGRYTRGIMACCPLRAVVLVKNGLPSETWSKAILEVIGLSEEEAGAFTSAFDGLRASGPFAALGAEYRARWERWEL